MQLRHQFSAHAAPTAPRSRVGACTAAAAADTAAANQAMMFATLHIACRRWSTRRRCTSACWTSCLACLAAWRASWWGSPSTPSRRGCRCGRRHTQLAAAAARAPAPGGSAYPHCMQSAGAGVAAGGPLSSSIEQQQLSLMEQCRQGTPGQVAAMLSGVHQLLLAQYRHVSAELFVTCSYF